MATDRDFVIKEAQKFAAKGQFDKAIAEWRKVSRETPDDANVFNTIGDLCLKKNSKAEAVDSYQKAGDILARDGFSSKAIALYKKVINIDPQKIEAHLALADLNAEKGLTGNALESYKIVANHYTSQKETRKALEIFRKMADLNASNVAFRLKLAEMYAKEGMKREAVAAYLQAADVHVEKSAFKDARQIFEKALAVDPNNKDVYHKAGLIYFKEGKFVEACKALKPAFESDPENTELAEVYLEAMSKAGRSDEAEEAYQRLVEADPDRVEFREKLYRLYLDRKDFGKAFSEVSSLANIRIKNNDLEGAENLLKEYMAEAPGNIHGMRALSALYKTIGNGNEAASLLVQAARILIENGDTDGALEELAKAVDLAPEHDEARQLMDSLQPGTLSPMSELASENHTHEAPILEDFSDHAATPEPDPELEEMSFRPEPETESAPSAFEPEAISAFNAPSPDLPPAEEPAISAAISEIDVLIKYGLTTKALEQLEGLAGKFPDSIQVRTRLRDIYGDIGNTSKAVSHMYALADIYMKHGMQAQADDVLELARGMETDNTGFGTVSAENNSAPEAYTLDEDLAPPPIPDDLGGPDLMQQGGAADDLSFPAPFDPIIEEPVAPPDSKDVLFNQPFTPPDFPPHEHIPEPDFVPESDETFEQPAEAPQDASASPDAFAGETDPSEIWAEAEFYYQQGLFDEARRHYERIIELVPDYGPARQRIAEINKDQEEAQEFSRLADAVTELEGLDGAGYAATSSPSPEGMSISASDEEAVRALMREISQLKQKQSPSAQQPSRKTAAPETKAAFELNKIEMNSPLYEEKKAGNEADDFFDLAAELRDELGDASFPTVPSASSEEQSLDDIFEEFKKGVEQQAVREDADTHYNLGVAYKEMGLLDDAISEFVMTPEDEPKYFQSRYMLGLCYMEKGDYQNAISEMQLARSIAERQGRPFIDRIGISYDLGLAFQGSGNNADALKEFLKVCEVDPSYRSAADKVKELRQGCDIPLSRLKTDIENEVSSKFLEEGERIEMEEKTKKNDRLRR